MRIGDHIILRRAALESGFFLDSGCEFCYGEYEDGEMHPTRAGYRACASCWTRQEAQARFGARALGILEDLRPGDDLEALLRKAAGLPEKTKA